MFVQEIYLTYLYSTLLFGIRSGSSFQRRQPISLDFCIVSTTVDPESIHMEGFGWDGPEVAGDTSLWNTNTPSGQQSYGHGPASYDVINSIQHQIDLQRAKASLIESSNSVRLVQSNMNQVHRSVVIAPPTSSQSTNPIPSGCNNFQCSSSNAADSNTKDSFDMLDCLFLATNSNPNGAVDEEAGTMSSAVILQDGPSRSFWNFGSGGAISSGDSKNDDACLHDSNKANAKEGAKKRRNNISEGGFQLIGEVDPPKPKRPRLGKGRAEKQNINRTPSSSNISFQLYPGSASPTSSIDQETDQEAMAQMKEFIYRAAAFRPVNLGLEVVEKPKRKNVRISSDPQTMAARQRRERISDRIRVLQRLVPGGTKMDTASMLDEAANYLKFLQSQIKALENLGPKIDSSSSTNCLPNINTLIFSSMPFHSHPFNSLQTHHSLPFQSHYISSIHRSRV